MCQWHIFSVGPANWVGGVALSKSETLPGAFVGKREGCLYSIGNIEGIVMPDIRLHFTCRGEGHPLLLLHGNGESGDYFARQIPYFSKSRKVYAVDTRGHGQSPRGTAPFTIDQFAEDLLCFMDRQGILRADILGFSDGGNIALTFALRYPHRVSRLILNGANLNPAGVKPSVQLPIILGYRAACRGRGEQARAKAELLGLMVKEPHIRPEDLAALRMPVLVIVGSRDMIRSTHSQMIADRLPEARMVVLKGDHFIASRRSAEFNQAVSAFLRDTEHVLYQ